MYEVEILDCQTLMFDVPDIDGDRLVADFARYFAQRLKKRENEIIKVLIAEKDDNEYYAAIVEFWCNDSIKINYPKADGETVFITYRSIINDNQRVVILDNLQHYALRLLVKEAIEEILQP